MSGKNFCSHPSLISKQLENMMRGANENKTKEENEVMFSCDSSIEKLSDQGSYSTDSLKNLLQDDKVLKDANFLYLKHSASPKSAPQQARACIRDVLSVEDASAVVAAAGSLGPDESSQLFARRTKSIGFVLYHGGKWIQLQQNFFNQNAGYNEFSGGKKLFYDELPPGFIQCISTQKSLSRFCSEFDIREGQLILLQVQSSIITPEDEGKCLTGQGIHSDGADRAMLVCLERENVVGARNSVFEDADGERAIVDRHVLEVGSTMFWKDNEIYHYVEPARLKDRTKSGYRTVMIAHYPAIHYITGETNSNNTLPPSGKHPRYVTAGQ